MITVFNARFSVPGKIVDTNFDTVQIAYQPPDEDKPRSDWFHTLGSGQRGGARMGDHHEDEPTRYRKETANG